MNFSASGFASKAALTCAFCWLVRVVAGELNVAKVFWLTEYVTAEDWAGAELVDTSKADNVRLTSLFQIPFLAAIFYGHLT